MSTPRTPYRDVAGGQLLVFFGILLVAALIAAPLGVPAAATFWLSAAAGLTITVRRCPTVRALTAGTGVAW